MRILFLVKEGNMKTEEQTNDLHQMFGGDSKIKIVPMAKTADWTDVVRVGKHYDVLAGDFTDEMLIDLTNPENNKKLIVRTVWEKTDKGPKYVGLESTEDFF